MDKRIGLVIVGVVLIVGAVVARGLLAPSEPKRSGEHVDSTLAAHYEDFLDAAPLDPAQAMNSLEKAKRIDPDNGYTDYLAASLAIKNDDLAKATEAVQAGNSKSKVIHYIAGGPDHEGMSTLNQMRRLSGYAKTLGSAEEGEAEAFFLAVEDAGYRVAGMIPMTTLTVAAGVSMIKNVHSGAISYYEANEKTEKLKVWSEWAASFDEWSSGYTKAMAEANNDIIRDVAKELNLSDDEVKDIVHNVPLKDSAKQAQVDQLFEEMVEKEKAVLKDIVDGMPRRPS